MSDFDTDFPELYLVRGNSPGPPTTCEQCGSPDGVKYEDSRTFYPNPPVTRFEIILEEYPLDPNRPIAFCRDCAKEHHERWDDQWAEYNSGRY